MGGPPGMPAQLVCRLAPKFFESTQIGQPWEDQSFLLIVPAEMYNNGVSALELYLSPSEWQGLLEE
jgi:hypothetical protein